METPRPVAKLLSMEAASREAGVTGPTLRRAAERGELPIVRIGSRTYTTPQALADFLTPRRQGPVAR